jgi:peptidoglycan/xylan/chitin deacetylase (PgdA/CDA1 family)
MSIVSYTHKILLTILLTFLICFNFSIPVFAENMVQATSNQFDIGLVSFHFDDGRKTVFTEAIPRLNKAHISSDQYLISCRLGKIGYVSSEDMQQMQSQTHIIGGHTRSHEELSKFISDKQRLKDETQGNRNDLIAEGANPVSTFAYPKGNGVDKDVVVQAVKDAGFIAARSTIDGFNYKDTNHYKLKRMPADKGASFEEMKKWIDATIKNKSWLILVFHQIDNVTGDYHIQPDLFDRLISYTAEQRKQGNLKVITTTEGVNMMNPI